jgi:hypothetical protein
VTQIDLGATRAAAVVDLVFLFVSTARAHVHAHDDTYLTAPYNDAVSVDVQQAVACVVIRHQSPPYGPWWEEAS